ADLYRRIGHGVCSHTASDGYPQCGNRRRTIVAGQIRNVKRGVALIVVSHEAESDRVQGAPFEPCLTAGDVANILMKGRRERGLNGPLGDSYQEPRAKSAA